MKLVDTSDIKRLLEEGAMDFKDLFDSRMETAGPCRQVRVDMERGELILLVDRQEIMSQSLQKFGYPDGSVPLERIDLIMSLWRAGKLDAVRQELGLKSIKRRDK